MPELRSNEHSPLRSTKDQPSQKEAARRAEKDKRLALRLRFFAFLATVGVALMGVSHVQEVVTLASLDCAAAITADDDHIGAQLAELEAAFEAEQNRQLSQLCAFSRSLLEIDPLHPLIPVNEMVDTIKQLDSIENAQEFDNELYYTYFDWHLRHFLSTYNDSVERSAALRQELLRDPVSEGTTYFQSTEAIQEYREIFTPLVDSLEADLIEGRGYPITRGTLEGLVNELFQKIIATTVGSTAQREAGVVRSHNLVEAFEANTDFITAVLTRYFVRTYDPSYPVGQLPTVTASYEESSTGILTMQQVDAQVDEIVESLIIWNEVYYGENPTENPNYSARYVIGSSLNDLQRVLLNNQSSLYLEFLQSHVSYAPYVLQRFVSATVNGQTQFSEEHFQRFVTIDRLFRDRVRARHPELVTDEEIEPYVTYDFNQYSSAGYQMLNTVSADPSQLHGNENDAELFLWVASYADRLEVSVQQVLSFLTRSNLALPGLTSDQTLEEMVQIVDAVVDQSSVSRANASIAAGLVIGAFRLTPNAQYSQDRAISYAQQIIDTAGEESLSLIPFYAASTSFFNTFYLHNTERTTLDGIFDTWADAFSLYYARPIRQMNEAGMNINQSEQLDRIRSLTNASLLPGVEFWHGYPQIRLDTHRAFAEEYISPSGRLEEPLQTTPNTLYLPLTTTGYRLLYSDAQSGTNNFDSIHPSYVSDEALWSEMVQGRYVLTGIDGSMQLQQLADIAPTYSQLQSFVSTHDVTAEVLNMNVLYFNGQPTDVFLYPYAAHNHFLVLAGGASYLVLTEPLGVIDGQFFADTAERLGIDPTTMSVIALLRGSGHPYVDMSGDPSVYPDGQSRDLLTGVLYQSQLNLGVTLPGR